MKALTIGALAVAWAGVAAAQTTTPSAPLSNQSEVPAPGSRAPDTPAVIHPGNPDPGITVAPPASGTTPVVPPPGTSGNASPVVPK